MAHAVDGIALVETTDVDMANREVSGSLQINWRDGLVGADVFGELAAEGVAAVIAKTAHALVWVAHAGHAVVGR